METDTIKMLNSSNQGIIDLEKSYFLNNKAT